ncbi:resolvase [Actinoplanes missouriensis]|uniref:helix-turn-helix domain-containing protein n=1 Tax=Actinoplanes missouriensis TaxID=1866 RepID=UPI00340F8CF9
MNIAAADHCFMTTGREAGRPETSMRDEVRRLRVDPGLSRAQLMRMFGVSNATLTDWLRGVEPPKRPHAKDHLRGEATRLRTDGWSLNDIATRLGVAKSTAFAWVGHIPLDPDSARATAKRELAKKRSAARWDEFRAERDRRQAEVWDLAARDVDALSDRDVLLMGAVAYWCEGRKSKPWAREDRLTFINSDPGLCGLFLRFLQLGGYGVADLKYRLSIHETADADEAADWWAAQLGLPRDQFRRPTIKKHVPLTRRANVGDDYHGCLIIEAPRSRLLYWRTEGVMRAVVHETSSAFAAQGGGR